MPILVDSNLELPLSGLTTASLSGSPLWPAEALGESPAEVLAAHQLLEFDEKATSLPRARHEMSSEGLKDAGP